MTCTNRKIVEYKIISGFYEDFESFVNSNIKNGWQPLGGVFYFLMGDKNCCSQAMVKYED